MKLTRRGILGAILGAPTMPLLARVKSVEVADVKPNDVIVVECSEHVSNESAQHIRGMLEQVWPGRQIVVLDKTLSIRIARETT